MDTTELSKNIQDLKALLETGALNRKSHWKKYRMAVKYARKGQITAEERDALGKIDGLFFDSWNVPKFSIKVGTILLSAGVLILESLYFLTFFFSLDFWFSIILYFLISLMNFILSHSLIHWLVGFPLGITFQNYFIFRSTFRKTKFLSWSPIAKIPIFGIKYNLSSFLSVPKWKRSLMFVSAPIFSWIWFLLNFIALTIFYSDQILILQLLGIIILAIFVFSQVIGFLFYGDYWKARQDY